MNMVIAFISCVISQSRQKHVRQLHVLRTQKDKWSVIHHHQMTKVS